MSEDVVEGRFFAIVRKPYRITVPEAVRTMLDLRAGDILDVKVRMLRRAE